MIVFLSHSPLIMRADIPHDSHAYYTGSCERLLRNDVKVEPCDNITCAATFKPCESLVAPRFALFWLIIVATFPVLKRQSGSWGFFGFK